jgi:hypothetical protein
MEVFWLAEALADLSEIMEYIAARNPTPLRKWPPVCTTRRCASAFTRG